MHFVNTFLQTGKMVLVVQYLGGGGRGSAITRFRDRCVKVCIRAKANRQIMVRIKMLAGSPQDL